MGRCFSTVYRMILVIFSAAALALSILSATSCQFLQFDHQYKGEGRYLFELEHNNHNARALQDDGTEEVVPEVVSDPPADVAGEEGVTTVGGEDALTTDELAALAPPATIPSVAELDADDAAADATNAAAAIVDSATAPDADATDAAAAAAVAPATTVASVVAPVVDEIAIETAVTTATATENGVTITEAAPVDDATVAAATPTAADVTAPSPSAVATPTAPTTPPPTKGFNVTPDSPTAIKEAAGYTDASPSAAATEAVATASGDAGLYCDGQKSFSVTNLWKGGSIKDLEAEIAEKSDKNQSEELARNAVLAATIFGSIIAFVLVLESIIGWRVWCERWIVGLVAIMACISQGVTFLFFNSQRYCDGDIVNEILNQEPCVMGQGGIFSVVATVLYAIILIMGCRLPQDDPYGLCGKKNRDTSTANNSNGDLSTGSSKFKFLSGKSSGDSAPLGTDDNEEGKPERPNWLSEEERDNEVI